MSDQENLNTHLMIVKTPKANADAIAEKKASADQLVNSEPTYYTSLKDAIDKGEELINKNPELQCDIYQIRVRLQGKIEIEEKHFNTGK